MEQSQVMRAGSRKRRAGQGLHEDKRSWEESHRLARAGAAGEPRESEVQERAGQDRARSKKVGKRLGSGGDGEKKEGSRRCECECECGRVSEDVRM